MRRKRRLLIVPPRMICRRYCAYLRSSRYGDRLHGECDVRLLDLLANDARRAARSAERGSRTAWAHCAHPAVARRSPCASATISLMIHHCRQPKSRAVPVCSVRQDIARRLVPREAADRLFGARNRTPYAANRARRAQSLNSLTTSSGMSLMPRISSVMTSRSRSMSSGRKRECSIISASTSNPTCSRVLRHTHGIRRRFTARTGIYRAARALDLLRDDRANAGGAPCP